MLIINADDFGRTKGITDDIVTCFREHRITSTSAMVFMQDSHRAARLSLEHNLEVGLHLNFDERFDGDVPTTRCSEYQNRVATFLTSTKYCQVLFNPLLGKEFRYLYDVQYEAFLRLYQRPPSHINGHHHMHLSTNVLAGRIIPDGTRVRRSFTFARGERAFPNRLYRRVVDRVVERHFITTDMLFAAGPSEQPNELKRKVACATHRNVELIVHLSSREDVDYLRTRDFVDAVGDARLGTYRDLPATRLSSDIAAYV